MSNNMKFAQLLLLLIKLVLSITSENVTKSMRIKDFDEKNLSQISSMRCWGPVNNCASSFDSEDLRHLFFNNMTCTCEFDTLERKKRDDYHYSPGIGAHKFHTKGATFNNARKICNEEGGHLAVIDSIAEEKVLISLFAKAKPLQNVAYSEVALIGMHDLFAEGDWVTILGDSIDKTGYVNWSRKWGGQPDNGNNRQHCGALFKNGEMDDVECDYILAFFCEISVV